VWQEAEKKAPDFHLASTEVLVESVFEYGAKGTITNHPEYISQQ